MLSAKRALKTKPGAYLVTLKIFWALVLSRARVI